MYKKAALLIFSFLLCFNFFLPITTVKVEAKSLGSGNTPITSSMYGGRSLMGDVALDSKYCGTEYDKVSKTFQDAIKKGQVDDLKNDDSKFSGIFKMLSNIFINFSFWIADGFTNLLLKGGCELGIAPSQFMQLVFFPVNIDGYSYLKTLTPIIQTVAICVLLITTVLAILELNNKQGSIEDEIISKIGLFLLSVAIIAFSKFILQGIYDIADALGYFVSHYQVSLNVVLENKKHTIDGLNLLSFPTLFVTYVNYAFSPKILINNPLTGGLGILILILVKIIVLFFITKDLLKIAVYGIKRLITMVSASVIIPILAALIPSNRTRSIFYSYFKTVISTSVAPILFGIIFLASTTFVLEDLVNFNFDQSKTELPPILEVIIITFFLNVMASIPDFVDGLIGSAGTMGAGAIDKGMSDFSWRKRTKDTRKSALGHYQGYNKTARDLKTDLGRRSITRGEKVRAYGQTLKNNFKYGKQKK